MIAMRPEVPTQALISEPGSKAASGVEGSLRILSIIAMASLGVAAGEEDPPLALTVPDGPTVAHWQPNPNPNKPYVAQLFAPAGGSIPLLDDAPEDHFHHHALMYAIGVDETDFWAEKGIDNAGRQEPTPPIEGVQDGGFVSKLNWLSADGKALVDETRKVRVRATGKDANVFHVLDWQSSIRPAASRDSVRLWGARYFGLGMRFLPAWTGRAGFLWQGSDGLPETGSPEKNTPGEWCAVVCEIAGNDITVLMIDHPANPRPASWFTMAIPFCYLSATLGLDAKPIELAAGESLDLRYGIAVFRGPAERGRLGKLAAEWRSLHSETDDAPPVPQSP